MLPKFVFTWSCIVVWLRSIHINVGTLASAGQAALLLKKSKSHRHFKDFTDEEKELKRRKEKRYVGKSIISKTHSVLERVMSV